MAHSAHWQLVQETERYETQISELQLMVADTQKHARQLVATHCNATALASKLKLATTTTACSSPQTSNGGAGSSTAAAALLQRVASAQALTESMAASLAVCESDLVARTQELDTTVAQHQAFVQDFTPHSSSFGMAGGGGGGVGGLSQGLGAMEERALGGLHRMEESVLAFAHLGSATIQDPPPPPPPPLSLPPPPPSPPPPPPPPPPTQQLLQGVEVERRLAMGNTLAAAEWGRRDRSQGMREKSGWEVLCLSLQLVVRQEEVWCQSCAIH